MTVKSSVQLWPHAPGRAGTPRLGGQAARPGSRGAPCRLSPQRGRARPGTWGTCVRRRPGWLYLPLTTLRPKKWASRRPVAPHTCCRSSPAVARTWGQGRGGDRALGAAPAGCSQGAHHATPPTSHRPLRDAGLRSGDTRKGLSAVASPAPFRRHPWPQRPGWRVRASPPRHPTLRHPPLLPWRCPGRGRAVGPRPAGCRPAPRPRRTVTRVLCHRQKRFFFWRGSPW